MKRIGRGVCLTLSGVVIHSGRHRVDFKKETPFITFMWSLLPPEMSLALWKHPFICSVIWADLKPAPVMSFWHYLKLCVQRIFAAVFECIPGYNWRQHEKLLYCIKSKAEKKTYILKISKMYSSFIHLSMNKDPCLNLHSSVKCHFWPGELILQMRTHMDVWEKSLFVLSFLFSSWKDLWSERMIKRQWPVCMTSIHLLCYFNDSNSFWLVALLSEIIIREPCQEVKCPLRVMIKDGDRERWHNTVPTRI